MGDYVLESNPALEHLIERLHAPGETLPPQESPSRNEHPKRSRRGWRSKSHAADRADPVDGEDHTAGGVDDRVDRHLGSPAVLSEETSEVVDNAIEEDSQPADDEILLVDFDEEPEIFDEDPDDDDGETDETDEVLDLYDDEDWDAEIVADEGAEIREGRGRKDGDWIFDAFEAWMLEYEAGLVDASIWGP